jgi:NADPH-dependent ferric siderophore reductase
MTPIGKTMGDLAARVAFRTAEVTAVTDHSANFRTIELEGEALQGVSWQAGDKLQVRTDPDGLAPRTYTPVGWDPDRGATRLLVYAHGSGPGSAWATRVHVGARCQVFGPRRSLVLDRDGAPLLFVGDETSFALAAAWHRQHPDRPAVASLFEVADPEEARSVLDAVGITGADLVARTEGTEHLPGLVRSVVEQLRANPEASLCLTGRAQTIAVLRRELKGSTVAGRTSLVKAYWDENRSGLD